MPDADAQEVLMSEGKASSSKIPGFHRIPTEGLRRLAERYDLGQERKGEKTWDANSENQEVLLDREFVLHRLGHVIAHALKLRDKIAAGEKLLGEGIDDDAGAIIWGGSFLCSATRVMQDRMDLESDPIVCDRCHGIGKLNKVPGSEARDEVVPPSKRCDGWFHFHRCELVKGHKGECVFYRGSVPEKVVEE